MAGITFFACAVMFAAATHSLGTCVYRAGAARSPTRCRFHSAAPSLLYPQPSGASIEQSPGDFLRMNPPPLRLAGRVEGRRPRAGAENGAGIAREAAADHRQAARTPSRELSTETAKRTPRGTLNRRAAVRAPSGSSTPRLGLSSS